MVLAVYLEAYCLLTSLCLFFFKMKTIIILTVVRIKCDDICKVFNTVSSSSLMPYKCSLELLLNKIRVICLILLIHIPTCELELWKVPQLAYFRDDILIELLTDLILLLIHVWPEISTIGCLCCSLALKLSFLLKNQLYCKCYTITFSLQHQSCLLHKMAF